MKHVDKLASINALLKAVKTSCVRTMQSHTYLIKCRLFRWLLLHTYYKLARIAITADHGTVKAQGSWVTWETPALNIRVLPPPLPRTPHHRHPQVDVNLSYLRRLERVFSCSSARAIYTRHN